jgi:glutamine phosphoribosylpyrophosphate amidotransferase
MEQNILIQDENPVREKILTIGNRTGLVWSEIAKVTGINKKVIKSIAKGELILRYRTECTALQNIR